MYETKKFVAAQEKAMASAHELAQLAIENAMAMTEIQFDATRNAVASTHTKAAHMLAIKDAQEALDIFKPEDAQEVMSEASAIQSKVAKVISKSHKEVVKMIESSIDDSQAELRKIAKEITGMAPTGSAPAVSMFEYMFDASLKSFDQAYATSKDTYASFEKSVNGVMSSFQDQFAPASKPATKSRKAIAA